MPKSEYVKERMSRMHSLHEIKEIELLLQMNLMLAEFLLSSLIEGKNTEMLFAIKSKLDALLLSHRETLKKSA